MRSSSDNHMDDGDRMDCVTGTAFGVERPYPVLHFGTVTIYPESREHVCRIRDELQRWLDTGEPFQSEHKLSEKDKQLARLVLLGKILPPAPPHVSEAFDGVEVAAVMAQRE